MRNQKPEVRSQESEYICRPYRPIPEPCLTLISLFGAAAWLALLTILFVGLKIHDGLIWSASLRSGVKSNPKSEML
jgi:hypothetical protein